ncbi:MAG: LamG domain-containing protein [Colwellia sp.]|nr:LamG domain-containing protein [Colwellia sp.]
MAGIDNLTKLMLHMDGSGSSFTDDSWSSGHVVTANGDATQSAIQSKFEGKSCLLDGTGDNLSISASADFDFNTNDFTIDFWAYFNGETGGNYLFHWDDNNRLTWDTNNTEWFLAMGGSSNTSITSISLSTWYHIAVVGDGSNVKLYIDGVEELSFTAPATAGTSGSALLIGSYAGLLHLFDGYIEEFRISNGIARWTTAFTPPTEAYSKTPTTTPELMGAVYSNPSIPKIKKLRTNPGWSVTPGMHVPVPIKMDKWNSIINYPARQKKRGRGKTQNAFVEFGVPTLPEITLDKWLFQHPVPRKRFEKKIVRPSEFVYNFVDTWQVQNGNYQDTGYYGFAITDTSPQSATFADSGHFGFTVTATHDEDFQLEDTGYFGFTIKYPDTGNESFNTGVPGFISVNAIIDGVNESNNIAGAINITREDNTAARFKCILELDQTLSPARKPAELINKEVSFSFSAAGMDGVVADYIPIFTGICKHVEFNDDIRSIIMSGYDYGGAHQTRGEYVSANVTDVLTGTAYASSATTLSLGHAPVWAVEWGGNSAVKDGEDYFINTMNGEIIIPISSRILQFPGTFTYNYMNPFDTMRDIIQGVMSLKGWTVEEDNVTIVDYSSTAEHPVLSLSNESTIDICRKFLELSGAKVETNLFPALRVYSEVQNVINTVNTHTVDEGIIFENSLSYRIDFDRIINEQTTRTVQKINANVEIGSGSTIAEFTGSRQDTDPRTVQQDVVWWSQFDLSVSYVVAEHRISKVGLNSIGFSSTGSFSTALIPFDTYSKTITGADWNFFTDGDDYVIQLKHNIIKLEGGGIEYWTIPSFEYTLTVTGSTIDYGEGTIEDIKSVTAQRPISGISETLAGDVYENAYAESEEHCSNINDAILLEHGNPYTCQFEVPVFEGKTFNIGDRINIERDSSTRFAGIIKKLSYTINLTDGQNAIAVNAKGVGFGI